jgi:chromosome segregation ATPase
MSSYRTDLSSYVRLQDFNLGQVDNAETTIIGMAAINDAIAAAKREASFEALARQACESQLQQARANLTVADDRISRLQTQLSDAMKLQTIVSDLREKLRLSEDKAAAAQSDVQNAEARTQAAKADVARKASHLKALQVGGQGSTSMQHHFSNNPPVAIMLVWIL